MVGLRSFSSLLFIGDSRGPPGRSVCESWTSANKFSIPLADFGVFGLVKFGLTPCGESELVEKVTFFTLTFSHAESHFRTTAGLYGVSPVPLQSAEISSFVKVFPLTSLKSFKKHSLLTPV